MAYGRLDVFWPDGKFDTFTLDEANVTVGRSPGNVIALDTDTISRYHFHIVYEDGQVYLVDLDSANGTFMDGGKVNGNERYPLRGGEEIQIGHLRMLFHALDETPTVPITSAVEDTQRIEKETRDFKIEVQVPDIAVTPGSYTSFEVMIANTGPENQTYTVEVSGLPDSWVRINRPQLEVESQDNETVVVNVKPLRRSDSAPGDYRAKVTVRPLAKPDAALEAEVKVAVQPFSGFGMALGAKRLGRGEHFRLHLHNQGSAPLPLQIMGRDLGHNLEFSVHPHQVNVGAGQRVQVQLDVKSQRKRLFGPIEEVPFDIVVRSIDLPKFTAATRGYFIDKPPFSLLLVGIMGIMGLFALALVAFGVLLLSRPPSPPAIASFIVNNGTLQVPQGQPVVLQWTVNNADSLVVNADGRPLITDIDPETRRMELETGNLTGEIRLSLVAENRGGTTSESRTLRVYQSVGINSFTYTPQQVVRNVVQTITFTWDAPGATSTSLSTVPGFQTINRQTNSVQITGLARENFTVTLTAEDDFGNVQQQTINVQLVNPECTSNQDRVNLYLAPNNTLTPVNSIPRGTVMVVDGRDQSGQWLRITQSSGIPVWAQRVNFNCSTNFNVEDLVTVVVEGNPPTNITPPLRTTTPVPAATVTTAPTPIGTPTVDPTGN